MQPGPRQHKTASSPTAAAAGRRAQVRQDADHASKLSPPFTPKLNIQPGLAIGRPGDKHEQDADRVAEQVVGQPLQRTPALSLPDSKKTQPRRPLAITPVIRQQAEESAHDESQFLEEEQDVQGKQIQLQEDAIAVSENLQPAVQMRASGGWRPRRRSQPSSRPRPMMRPAGRAPPVMAAKTRRLSARAPPLRRRQTAVQKKISHPSAPPQRCGTVAPGGFRLTPIQEKGGLRPNFLQCRGPPAAGRTEASEGRLEQELSQSRGGGMPMPAKTRLQMETGIGADFRNVRIHTDAGAARMNDMLGSQAFATDNDVYFGAGRYDPESLDGQRLLAHELTHTVQQNASPRRQDNPVVSPRGPPVQPSMPDLQGGFIGDRLNRYARHVPGWELFTVIIEYNPLTEQDVARTPQNLLRGFMGLITGGTALYDKLNSNGLIDDAFTWLQQQLSDLNLSWSRLRNAIDAAWEEMDFIRLDPFDFNLRVLKRHLLPIWNDVKTFAGRVIDKTVELFRTTLLPLLVNFIKERTRAYPLLTVILGEDPVTGEAVDRSLYNIVSAFLMLTESGENYLNKLNESGKLQELSDWLDAEIERLDVSVETVTNAFGEAWDLLDLNAVLHPIDTFTRLYNIFAGPVTRLFNFVVTVALRVLGLIKDWLVGLLKEYANDIPGYPLLRVILGRDPLTGEDVPRTAENFIMGFLSFVPGGREKFQNLQESGAIDKAFAWLEEAIGRLGLIGEALLNAFVELWETFSIDDLMNPVAAFHRVVAIFTEPVQMIIDFAIEVGMKILEFIFEGVLGPTGARVLAILKRARSTFTMIINDPIAFVGNLVNAVKQGFRQFAGNILQHLQAGLIGWLTGALGSANITLPERFDFKGILSLVMQVLGITWARVRQKLVRRLGERTVSILETGFEVVRILVTEGPAGLWERLVEHLGNLRDTVIDGIKNFIITRIVTAAVTRIATMLNPAGAVIQAIIAIYNTIMFFIERINQIIDLVEAVVNSIANIAEGKLADAANYVEQSMARTIPVIISFLARLIGLGNISGAIQNILRRVHRAVDRAIDRVIAWIARQARRLIRAGRGAVAAIAGWFRRRVPFRAPDGRGHSLYFEGSDRNPQLKVRSTPVSIQSIIDTGQFAGRSLSNRKKSRLRDKYAQLRRETNKAARGGRVIEAVVQRHLESIKNILGTGGDEPEIHYPTGEPSDPVLINWYKKVSDYPRVFGATPRQGFTRRLAFRNARGGVTERVIRRGVDPRNFLNVNEPATRTGSEGRGTQSFFTNEQIEAIWRQEGGNPESSRTPEGNRRLPDVVGRQGRDGQAAPGSVGSIGGDVRRLGRPTNVIEIDHVKDLNLGGDTGLTNLWPASASANRAWVQTQNQAVITSMKPDLTTESKRLTDTLFTTKFVRAVSRSNLTAQNQARITLMDQIESDRRRGPSAVKDNYEITGVTESDPFPIAWFKHRSQYPTYRPVNSDRDFNIGQRTPIRMNPVSNTAQGNRYMHVSPENYDPIGTTWLIRRSTDVREATQVEQEQLAGIQAGEARDRRAEEINRREQESVGGSIRRGYDTSSSRVRTPPRVVERNPESGQSRELLPLDPRSYLEADHVLDVNFGGSEAPFGREGTMEGNLWPLPANKNRAANAVNEQYVAYKRRGSEAGEKTLLKNVPGTPKVKVVEVVGIPSSASGHGTSADRPAGWAELLRMGGAQSKAWNSDATDRYEQEADRVADLVTTGNRDGALVMVNQISPKDQSSKPRMQKQEGRPSASANLDLSGSSGSPMSSSVSVDMENGFGRDFSDVRIHDDNKSHEVSGSIGARAFTKSADIYFAQGQYNPSTVGGKRLLAHELTHVVQQDSRIRRKPVEPVATALHAASGKEAAGPPVLGGSAMPGLEPPVEGEILSPAQVEAQAEAQAGIKMDQKAPGVGKEEKPKAAIEKPKPAAAGRGEKKEAEVKPDGKASQAAIPMPDKTGSSDGMLNEFMTSPASQMAAAYPALGAGVSETLKAEKKQEADTAPRLAAKAGKGAMPARPPPGEDQAPREAAIEEKQPPAPAPQKVAGHQDLAGPVDNARNNKALDQSSGGGWLSWFKDRALSFTSAIRTKDGGVNTKAGKPPKAALAGEADPDRAKTQRRDGDRQAGAQKDKVSAKIKANPGKQRIQPAPVEEDHGVRIEAAVEQVETAQQDDMADYAGMPLPDNVRKKADQDMAPLLEKSLAKPRGDVKKAADQRKADKQAEVSKARAEVNQLNQKADQDQKQIVDTSRSDVASEQKKGLDDADRQVKKYRKEADKEQTTLRDSVKKRVRKDEGKAAAELKKAEADARKEKQKKEAEAAAKKRELKKAQKKKSWWDRVVDAVKSVVKAITKVIDGIFNALRQAVKFIIDTAKKAALAVIELGRKFVVGLLNTFRTFLKSLVSNLIGKIFPELAARINRAIDKAVDKAIAGVNKVADALKRGVEALANALGKVLDKILSVFQTALKAAVQIAGALLTGDFAEAAKIAFYAACDILGINPKSVIDFMEKAGASLGKIFKSPSKFFSNVAKGVKKGIDQFVAKIKQHLLNGLIAWLTGAMGDVQITLPEKFDIKGIFSLVTQILGLTYANIRAKVVKRLGPKGEQIVSTLEKTFALVRDLVTKGPIVLWERVKQSLSGLKDRIMEGIRNMVITKVVKAGVVWLISMLNPASALVKAIKMLYDLVMFFVERWDQIVAFATSIWNSVEALANGRIGAAANAVEQALARSIPVILGLLASLLSLGGIGKDVRKVIGKIRKPIDAAMDRVIEWIVRQGRSLLNRLRGRGDPAARQAVDPANMTPDQKKAAAKNELEQWIRGGDRQGGAIKAKLPALKQKYRLSDVRLEMTAHGPRIGYYASAGEFTYFFEGQELKNVESTTSAGFKTVNSAAGVPTPKGVINQKYPGQVADDAFRCSAATLDRPGSVVAEQTGIGSSQNRGSSSVQGNAGYVGLDEEQIMAGHRNTSYRGGHLIAYVILGDNSNQGYNLAPQVNRFNAPAYFKIFEEVAMKTPTTVEISVDVGYTMNSYQVDQQTLVDRGILTRIDPNRDWTVSLAKRIPKFWNATIVAKQGSLVEGGVASTTDTATQGRVVDTEAEFNSLKVDGDGNTEKVQKWNSFKMLITEGGQRNNDGSLTTGGSGRTRLSVRAEQLDFAAPSVQSRPAKTVPANGQAKFDADSRLDPFEQEADAVAERVVQNRSGLPPPITDYRRTAMQAQMGSKSAKGYPASVEALLQAGSSVGRPLPAPVRSSMEAGLGADLSQVRIHTDPLAVLMTRQMGAEAFTQGNHIYFNQGRYAPETSVGRRLLAHELAHVLQQDSHIRRKPLAPTASPVAVAGKDATGPPVVGGAAMPDLEPSLQGEIPSPAQVEALAKAEAEIIET